MYFWKGSAADELPEFTVDATKEFQPYFERLNKTPQGVGEQALEFLVLSWLTDIARVGDSRAKADPSGRWLADSGLIHSLEKARIEMNPA